MNGYTKSTHYYRRLANLIEQIPQPVRMTIAQNCIPADGNVHDWERNLTGVCLRKEWEPTVTDLTRAAYMEAPENLGTHFGIDGEEVIEFGSKQWFDSIDEIPF